MNQIMTLLQLNEIELDIQEAQATLDEGRSKFFYDSAFQLEMDQAQTRLDKDLAWIQVARALIAQSN